ncbi:MAG: autotransporter-associated beta strand repeat-containing protein [Akkermansiaceae bacterium]|nr:autotransporter-associated beta strand repeat-containing protein [Akkermansiaceae bacterium]
MNATRNNDIATFNQAVTTFGNVSNPILIDANRFLKGITFDSASVGSYYIGTTGGQLLQLDQAGSITMNSAVTSSQFINAPIRVRAQSSFNPTYTLRNDATSSSATLNIGGAVATNSSTGRGVNWVLDGSNTGDNTISGVISGGGSGGYTAITKNGAGTWRLTNSNTLNAVVVNNGTLYADHASALGTGATTVNGGTVAINNLTLASSVVNLNSSTGTGTIRGIGTNAVVNSIAVNGTATTVGLATTSASDILTANSLSGGQASSVIQVSGPGTISLANASSYAGGWSIDSGTVLLGNASALGTSSTTVNFGSGSTGKLALNGNSITVDGLNTGGSPGSATIENGAAGTATVTLGGAGSSSFGGVLQDGSAGVLALTMSGTGVQELTGANTYSGGTTVSNGVLKVNNLSGSATGSGTVTLNGTGILGGTGTISGLVDLQSGGTIAPGNSVGDLTVGSLSAASGSIFEFEFNSNPANDRIFVTDTNGLTLNGGGFNLYQEGTTSSFSTIGTYNLINYSGSIGGTGTSALTTLNPVAGYSYVYDTSGGWVTLDVAAAGVISQWDNDSDGSWGNVANWSGSIPNAAGDSANFTSAISSGRTITLDGDKTVGGVSFDNANSYTMAQGSGGSLILDGQRRPGQRHHQLGGSPDLGPGGDGHQRSILRGNGSIAHRLGRGFRSRCAHQVR